MNTPANTNETPQSTNSQITVVTPQGTVLTREDANLIDMMSCLPLIDSLRTELRSWFLAYITHTELNKASLTCDYYETLDGFLNVVINKGIEQLAKKGGEANV